MPRKLQAPVVAIRKTHACQRLRQPAPKLSWRWENRYVLAQPLRAVGIGDRSIQSALCDAGQDAGCEHLTARYALTTPCDVCSSKFLCDHKLLAALPTAELFAPRCAVDLYKSKSESHLPDRYSLLACKEAAIGLEPLPAKPPLAVLSPAELLRQRVQERQGARQARTKKRFNDDTSSAVSGYG